MHLTSYSSIVKKLNISSFFILTVLSFIMLDSAMGSPLRSVSLKGNYDLPFIRKEGMLPRGSALITSSGQLKEQGIKAIIHAAPGSMGRSGGVFNPTPDSLRYSIRNSMILARRHKHERVAIPFLGGGIFASRMGLSKEQLARLIIGTVVYNKMNLDMVFVLYSEAEEKLFSEIIKKHFKGIVRLSVVRGSITDHSLHGASAIINAANMEVQFGGGVSGVIGDASGEADEIDNEASKIIQSL